MGEPVIGASVKVVGTTNGAVTDLDGNFALTNVPKNATVEISYIGYTTQKVSVAGKSDLKVTLQEDNKALDEVVVVGYGVQRKSDVTGALAHLDSKDLTAMPVKDALEGMQGRTAGVDITNSQRPGTVGSITIRGQRSIGASSAPLYVVDGMIIQNGGIENINPQDIESIEVLKDASATAIYGAQGANGVVLITTKKGKAGEAKFTYTGSVAASRQNKRLDIMNLREFAEYYNDLANQGEISKPDPVYSDPSILGIGTNWQDAIFQTAWQQSHQIAAEGGTDKVNYYISGNWTDQDGTIIGSEFQRYSMRVNLSAQLKKWFKLGLNATYSKTAESLKLADGAEGLINYSLTTPPDIQIYNIDGGYSSVSKEGFTNPNPIAMAMEDDILLDRQSLNGSVFADITLMKGLTWHSQLGFDIGASKAETYNPMIDLGTWKRQSNQSRLQKNSNNFWSLNNYLQYSTTIGKHSITAMLGQECWESRYDYVSAFNTNLPNDVVHNPSLGQGDPQIGSGWGSSSMASFFTRETYNYDDRYLATYTYRYDGSSNFGPNNRWAGFHSLALGWRFTNEQFMKGIKWLSNGKLRLGWGQTGNSNIGGYKWGSAMSTMDTALGTSFRPANLKNLDIKWETQEQWNVGLDLGFFNSRVNLTVDWYKKMSKDMLMQLNLPSIMGTSGNASSALAAPYGNYGDIENTGLEIALNTHPIVTKDFDWSSDVTISINKNKLKSLSGSTALLGKGQWSDVVSRSTPGESLYNFYGYVVEGVYKDYNDIISSPVQTLQKNNPISVTTDADGTKHYAWIDDPSKFSRSNTTYVGDLKYKDINGDGIIDENDKTNIGSPLPKWTFGWNNTFRYKNFDLNIFINGSVGAKVANYLNMKMTHMNSPWSNQLKDVNKRVHLVAKDGNQTGNWYDNISNLTVDNPNSMYPRASINDPNDNDAFSDRYIEDGSYLRLKSMALGYTFDQKLIQKIGLTNLRLTLTASNLFTITGYSGYDPEVGLSTQSANVYGLDFGRYPSPTTVTFGLNLSF